MGGSREDRERWNNDYEFSKSNPFKSQKEGLHPQHKQTIMSVQLNTPINGTVKSVTGAGDFTNDFGTFNSWEYTMTDGTVLKANHKNTTQPFAEGSEIEYEIKRVHAEHGNSGKVGKRQDNPQPNVNGTHTANTAPTQTSNPNAPVNINDSILYQVCLKGAMDHYTEMSTPGQNYFTSDDINRLALDIAKIAKENIAKL